MDERDPTRRTPIADEDDIRRLEARKHNEKTKLRASLYNALAVALIGAAFIFPVIRDEDFAALLEIRTWVWILAGVGLHSLAYRQIDRLRRED